MPRVHCSLPNASDEINGVKFVSHADGGVVSEDVSEEVAANFASIPGYSIVGAPAANLTGQGSGMGGSASTSTGGDGGAAAAEAAELEQLRARGVELQIPHAAQMGAKRLKEEIAKAEAPKA